MIKTLCRVMCASVLLLLILSVNLFIISPVFAKSAENNKELYNFFELINQSVQSKKRSDFLACFSENAQFSVVANFHASGAKYTPYAAHETLPTYSAFLTKLFKSLQSYQVSIKTRYFSHSPLKNNFYHVVRKMAYQFQSSDRLDGVLSTEILTVRKTQNNFLITNARVNWEQVSKSVGEK